MKFHITPDIPPDAVFLDENGQACPDIKNKNAFEMIRLAMAHQSKCQADATEVLKFYFNENGAINLEFLEQWLEKNQPVDRWFFVHLIEVAGQRFLAKSYSAHKAAIAHSKNATPRAWVLEQWRNKSDQAQKKAEFARQYSPLVKKQFGLIVNPETIARDWLPKVKK
ncbi:MAG: hypothetical protein K0B09_15235 [Bacteroidales bacterium]|nr:hypothetical protein [Bacteroidales bacterium]